jgi:hypothetical protein
MGAASRKSVEGSPKYSSGRADRDSESPHARNIDHPILGNTMAGVQGTLGTLIEGKTAIRYLDEQQHTAETRT